MKLIKACAGTITVSMGISVLCAMFNFPVVGSFFLVLVVIAFVIMLLDFIFGDH